MAMKRLTKFVLVAVSSGLIALPAAAQNPTQADNTAAQVAQQNGNEPHMASALEHLKNADQKLSGATSDKGGHRVKAMQALEQAMSQVEQGIQYAKTQGSNNNSGAGQPLASSVQAVQTARQVAQQNQQIEPNMSAALQELAEADQDLQQASTNKGGHRMQGMQLTEQAMSEVEQGIQYYSQQHSGMGAASQPQSSPAAASNPNSVRITNGPVIERADQRSAVIAWSTDRQGSTVVDYGTDPNNLNQKAEAAWGANGLTHRVELKNLQPGTKYYFEVETGQAKGTGGAEVESNRFAFTTPNAGQGPIQNQQPVAAHF